MVVVAAAKQIYNHSNSKESEIGHWSRVISLSLSLPLFYLIIMIFFLFCHCHWRTNKRTEPNRTGCRVRRLFQKCSTQLKSTTRHVLFSFKNNFILYFLVLFCLWDVWPCRCHHRPRFIPFLLFFFFLFLLEILFSFSFVASGLIVSSGLVLRVLNPLSNALGGPTFSFPSSIVYSTLLHSTRVLVSGLFVKN